MDNQDILAKKIIAELDAGLDNIPADALQQLRSARERACLHARQHAHTRVGHSMALMDKLRQHRTGLLGAALIMVLFTSLAMWQSNMINDEDTASIDTELLTGDLPVNAYLDGHLSKWVNNDTE